MTPVRIVRGSGPLVLAMPHVGTDVPPGIARRLTPLGRTLGDTDWHVERLYRGLLPGATRVMAGFHRYVVDANRDPDGASLYPGMNTTGLVPLTDFDGRPLWLEGQAPDAGEIAERTAAWHRPYHDALAAELERVRAANGVAILFDCHSIRSEIPFLFDGVLPDFNIGTNGGTSCSGPVEAVVAANCAAAPGYTSVVNGRFKGGWTTRHYGRPRDGIHAIQMELAQKTHLETETVPFRYDPRKAGRLRVHLRRVLRDLAAIAPSLGGKP